MGHGKTNNLTVKDNGWKRLMKLGDALAEAPFVKVGVLGRNDSRGPAKRVGAKTELVVTKHGATWRAPRAEASDVVGNVELAVIHEFGLGVPRRSFLRGTMARLGPDWTVLLERLARLLVAGKIDVSKALTILGLRAANDVKATIQQSTGLAPLDPATIRAKGSSKPLIDTGRLLGSVDFEIVPGGSEHA